MGAHFHAEIAHHLLKDLAAGNRPVVHIEHLRDALQRKVGCGFWCHSGKQKPQRRFDVFPVDAMIFLIGHAAAIVDHAVDHQNGTSLTLLHPLRRLDLFEVRRAQIEVPAFVAILGLEPHRGGRAQQGVPVVAPLLQIPIDRRPFELIMGGLQMPFRCLNAVGFQEPNGFLC